jgi:hypothetical protein
VREDELSESHEVESTLLKSLVSSEVRLLIADGLLFRLRWIREENTSLTSHALESINRVSSVIEELVSVFSAPVTRSNESSVPSSSSDVVLDVKICALVTFSKEIRTDSKDTFCVYHLADNLEFTLSNSRDNVGVNSDVVGALDVESNRLEGVYNVVNEGDVLGVLNVDTPSKTIVD